MGELVRLDSSGGPAKGKPIDELHKIAIIGTYVRFGKSERTWEPITINEALTIWQLR